MMNSYEYPPAEVQDEIVKAMIQECINSERNAYLEYNNFKLNQFYPNGYGVSIIRNKWSYGGADGLYELAVLKGDEKHSSLNYDTPITSDVIGYLTMDEAMDIADKVKELPSSKKKRKSKNEKEA